MGYISSDGDELDEVFKTLNAQSPTANPLDDIAKLLGKPPDYFSTPDPVAVKSTGWWTPERINQGINHLKKAAKLPHLGAAALIARSAGVEAAAGPTSVNPGKDAAFGNAQWLGPRKAQLFAFAKARGKDPTDPELQWDFQAHELNTSESFAAKLLRNAKTPRDAAIAAAVYERAEGYDKKNPLKGDNHVNRTLEMMGKLPPIKPHTPEPSSLVDELLTDLAKLPPDKTDSRGKSLMVPPTVAESPSIAPHQEDLTNPVYGMSPEQFLAWEAGVPAAPVRKPRPKRAQSKTYSADSVVLDVEFDPTTGEPIPQKAIPEQPDLQRVKESESDNAVAKTIEIPEGVRTEKAAQAYINHQLKREYPEGDFSKFGFLGKFTGKPVKISVGALKDAGVDTASRVREKIAQDRIENPEVPLTPVLAPGEKTFAEHDADSLNKLSEQMFGWKAPARVFAAGLSGLSQIIPNYTAFTLRAGGAGVEDEILSNGGAKAVDTPYSRTIDRMRTFVDNLNKFHQGTGDPDSPLTFVADMVGVTPKFIVMSTLPGGLVLGLAMDRGGAGTIKGSDPYQFLGHTARGATEGAIFQAMPWANSPVKSTVLKAGIEASIIGSSMYGLGAISGDNPEDNLLNAGAIAIAHLLMKGGSAAWTGLKGKVFHGKDARGNEVYQKVTGTEEKPTYTTVEPQSADVEFAMTKPPLRSSEGKDVGNKQNEVSEPTAPEVETKDVPPAETTALETERTQVERGPERRYAATEDYVGNERRSAERREAARILANTTPETVANLASDKGIDPATLNLEGMEKAELVKVRDAIEAGEIKPNESVSTEQPVAEPFADSAKALEPTGTDKNGLPKTVIHEKGDMGEYPVHRVTINGEDRYIQRIYTQDLGTNWHEVTQSEKGGWYPKSWDDPSSTQMQRLISDNLGTTKAEALEVLQRSAKPAEPVAEPALVTHEFSPEAITAWQEYHKWRSKPRGNNSAAETRRQNSEYRAFRKVVDAIGGEWNPDLSHRLDLAAGIKRPTWEDADMLGIPKNPVEPAVEASKTEAAVTTSEPISLYEVGDPVFLKDGTEVTVSKVAGDKVTVDNPNTGESMTVKASSLLTEPAGYGEKNTYFTKERKATVDAEISRIINESTRTAGVFNFTPELFSLLVERGGYHVEAGARSFAEFSRRMLAEFRDRADEIRPYLASIYQAIRDLPGFDSTGMDDRLPTAAGDGIRRTRQSVPNMEEAGLVERDAITGNYRYYDSKAQDPQVQLSRAEIEHIGIDAAFDRAVTFDRNPTTEETIFQGQVLKALKTLTEDARRSGADLLVDRYTDMSTQLGRVWALTGTESAQVMAARRTAYDSPIEAAVIEVEAARSRKGLSKLTPEEKAHLEDAAKALQEKEAAVLEATQRLEAEDTQANREARQAALDERQKAFTYHKDLTDHLANPPDTANKKFAQLIKSAMVSAVNTAANNLYGSSLVRGVTRVRDLVDVALRKVGQGLSDYRAPMEKGEVVFHDGKNAIIVEVKNGVAKVFVDNAIKAVGVDEIIRQPVGLPTEARFSDIMGIPHGEAPEVQHNAFINYFRQTGLASRIVKAAAAEYPELMSRLRGDYQSGIADLKAVREESGGPLHKTLDFGLLAFDKANFLGRWQEYYTRDLQVLHSLQARLGARGLNLTDMEARSDFRQITKADWEYAIEEARRVSFSLSPKTGSMAEKILTWSDNHPITSVLTVPFARFTWNAYNLTRDWMPILAQLRNGKKQFNRAEGTTAAKLVSVFNPTKYTSTEMANSIVGLGLLATSYGLLKNFVDKENYSQIRIPGTEGMGDDGKNSLYLDLRPAPPFLGFMFMADKLDRFIEGKPLFTYNDKTSVVGEITEALGGLSYRSSVERNAAINTLIYGAEHLYDKYIEGADTERNDDKAIKSLFQMFGNYTGVFLTPGKPLKALVDEITKTPDKNFDDHPFLEAYGRVMPKVLFGSIPDRENAATGELKRRRFDWLKPLGLTVSSGTELPDQMTPGELITAQKARGAATYARPFLAEDKFVADLKREFERESDRIRATGDDSGLEALRTRIDNYVASGALKPDDAESITKNLLTSDLQENFSRISAVPKPGATMSDLDVVWAKLNDKEKETLRPALAEKVGRAIVDGKIPATADLSKFGFNADSVDGLRRIGQAKATQEAEEKDIIEQVKSGDLTAYNNLPIRDKNKILKETKLPQDVQEFVKQPVANRVFFFENQEIEKQAALLPYLEQAKQSLSNKKADADVATKAEVERALAEYKTRFDALPPIEKAKLLVIKEKAQQTLQSAKPIKPLNLGGSLLPSFKLPSF